MYRGSGCSGIGAESDRYLRQTRSFNNAGIDLTVKPLHEQAVEDFDKIVSVNARLFLCMKYEIQQMLTQGSGAIVNNSSTNGLAQGSLPMLPKRIRDGADAIGCLDYAKQGIRINAVNRVRLRLT